MGLFGSASPFDADVEKATSETNTSEQWDVIIDICDKVGSSSKNAKDCIRAIMKRVGHNDPHVAIQAITLLDACIKNCGQKFHLEIASREFETEFQRLMSKAPVPVAQKMRVSLKKWADNEFKSDSQLNLIPSLYQKLKSEGLDFSDTSAQPVKVQPVLSKDPNVVSSQQEEDDIAKAIELSLKDKGDGAKAQTTTSYPSLYPTMNMSSSHNTSAPNTKPDARKVRALYDFEAAEDNELTFLTGEIIHVLDDTDPNWWKGYNDRGEGLFPSNFVTADLNAEPESTRFDNNPKKSVQLVETEEKEEPKPDTVEIDESKIDRLLYLLHEANPEDPSQDTEEMFMLEAQVNQMLPLIDTELERVDRNHAKLTQLSGNLVDAINMYHTLMRDSDMQIGSYNLNQVPSQMYRQAGQPPNGMYNPNVYPLPPNYSMQQQIGNNQFSTTNQMANSLPHIANLHYHGQQNIDSMKFAPNAIPITGQQPISLPVQQQPSMQIHQQLPPQYQYQPEQQHHSSQLPPSTEQTNTMHGLNTLRNNQIGQQHVHQQMQSQAQLPPFQQHAGIVPRQNFPNMPTAMNNQNSALPQPMLNHPSQQQQQQPHLNMPGYLPNTVMTTQVQQTPPGLQQSPVLHMQNSHHGHVNAPPPNHHHPMGMIPNHLAAINQPVTSTILPQSDSRSNIPIFQQQR